MKLPRIFTRMSTRTALLIGLNLTLAALLVSVIRERADVPLPPSALDTASVSASEIDVLVRSENLAIVGTQPVFHRTRQFVRPPDPAAVDLRPPPPSYQFAGAMLLPGKPPLAYLRGAQASQSTKVSVGEILEGWTVQAIEPRAVVLAFEGETITIGSAQAPAAGIVAVAPRAASSEPAPSGGLRVLGTPAQGGRSASPPPGARPVQERKPRTYQPPPPS